MKQKLTVTIDRELVPRAKRFARERGVSVSSLIEGALREMTADEADTSFSAKWRGRLVLAEHDDARFRALIEKYG
jgi:post-segregation antitoxin (ccd killing protein)